MNKQSIFFLALTSSLIFNSCSTKDNKEYYYDKDNTISYDDIILTMYEKNIVSISDIGKGYINSLENVPIEYNAKYIDLLDINYNSLTSKYVVNNTNSHLYNKYYDLKNNTIKWDILVDTIYDNSKNKVVDTNLLLSKQEIKIILLQMDEFLNMVKYDYPTFDVSNLACKLNDLSIVYFYRDEDEKAEASCVYDTISIGINRNEAKPNLNSLKSLLFHEFKHYFCFCCKDEMIDSYSTAGGISSKNGYDIDLLFLEEAEAEEYSSLKSNIDMNCYSNQYTILNTLRLVLSLQDDYEEDNFIKNQLLHNPISLLQQFPVYNDNNIYFRNIVMLECFNELLMNQNNIDNSIKKEVYQTLLNYSFCELNRMFFSNLISLNEKYNVSLDYNIFLIELYKEQINNNYNLLNNIDLDNSMYLYNFKQCSNIFIEYYSKSTNIDIDTINQYVDYYKLRVPSEYPTYVEDSKIKLYEYIYSNKNNNVLIYK